jgi:hypothetical protein
MAGSVIEIVPFDEAQGRAAAVAFDRYGKDFHANVAQRARHVRLKPRADDKHFIMVLAIRGLIRRLDAHHLRPTLAPELQRLALDRIKVRGLAGFDRDRHAGSRQSVHLVAVDYFG